MRNTIAITYGTQNLVKINDSIRKAGGVSEKSLCVICGLNKCGLQEKRRSLCCFDSIVVTIVESFDCKNPRFK